jgi:hypothetical protein
MYNLIFKQIRLNVNRLIFCTFCFWNHNIKYINYVLFAFVPMNSLILCGLLLHILEINLSTTPSIELLFVHMFSFLAYRGSYPKTDGMSRKVAIVKNVALIHCAELRPVRQSTPFVNKMQVVFAYCSKCFRLPSTVVFYYKINMRFCFNIN